MGRRAGHDAVVIGGGPAGCAAATTLARTGRSVVLVVDRRPHRTFGVGEGAPPGLDRAVDDVFGHGTFVPTDHLRSLGNRAAWGTGDLLRTDFMFNPFGTGWHLDRVAFDASLLAAAEAAGATLRTSLDGGQAVAAPVVIDASGRRADHARHRGARRIASDRLIAVLTTYPRADTDADATTTVEAVEAGWWYTCPIPQHRRVVAFLTDADLLAAELRTSAGFDRARPPDDPHRPTPRTRCARGPTRRRGRHGAPRATLRRRLAGRRRRRRELRSAVVAGDPHGRADGVGSGAVRRRSLRRSRRATGRSSPTTRPSAGRSISARSAGRRLRSGPAAIITPDRADRSHSSVHSSRTDHAASEVNSRGLGAGSGRVAGRPRPALP